MMLEPWMMRTVLLVAETPISAFGVVQILSREALQMVLSGILIFKDSIPLAADRLILLLMVHTL